MSETVWTPRNGERLLLRSCTGLAEFEACVQLQQQTWGYADREVMPRKGFVLARELGGQVIGAFDPSGDLVAFAMAMPALGGPPELRRTTRGAMPPPYLHSHMLAVAPPYRNSGVGRRLKLLQREDALARGIVCMTWTFDPLAARNAHFNLHRLGAVARRYSPDFYGVSSSRLQGGLPSDRLHAEWWMQSARVCARVASMEATGGREVETLPSCVAQEETILLPGKAELWRDADEGQEPLAALQLANRAHFLAAFGRGLTVVDFTQDNAGNGVFHLARWQPDATPLENNL